MSSSRAYPRAARRHRAIVQAIEARDADAAEQAVLRLIDATTRGAAVHQRPVAVCGGLAADPAAVPLLLGLGVTELSVVPGAIPRLKAQIRGLTLDRCRELAQRALQLGTAAEVRALVNA